MPDALASDDERAAVDARARRGELRLGRGRAHGGGGTRGSRRSRGARTAPPAAPRPACPAIERRMDQPRRPPLRVRAPHGPSRRGLRRGDLLRDVLGRTASDDGPALVRRHRLQGRGRRGTDRRGRPAGRIGAGAPEPVHRHVRTGAGGAPAIAGRQGRGLRPGVDRAARSVPARRPLDDDERRGGGCGRAASGRGSRRSSPASAYRCGRSDVARRLPGARRVRGAPAGGRARSRRRDRRAQGFEAAQGRGGAAFPAGREVGGRRRSSRSNPTTSSATPTNPSPGRSRTGC